MLKRKTKFLFFPILIIVFLFSLNFCLAAGLVPNPGGSSGASCDSSNCGNYTLNDVTQIFVLVARAILGIAGALSLLMFIVAGVMLIISGGNKERVQKGQQMMIASALGLIIVFVSYLVIQFTLQSIGAVDNQGFFTEGNGFTGTWNQTTR